MNNNDLQALLLQVDGTANVEIRSSDGTIAQKVKVKFEEDISEKTKTLIIETDLPGEPGFIWNPPAPHTIPLPWSPLDGDRSTPYVD